jgi:hypothetical protein
MKITRNPKIVQLARELGMDLRGNCAEKIKAYALERVRSLIRDFEVTDLDAMQMLLANKLRAKVEFIRTDADVQRIATEHAGFHPHLRKQLQAEFITGDTEGITLERDGGDGKIFQYLAIVDARGARLVRSYFTGWHELVHLLIHPPQLAFAGFRRSPPVELIDKDPIESLVDSIAGEVAFFRPIYGPVFEDTVTAVGAFSFTSIAAARDRGAPSASLYSASLAGLRLTAQPALFLTIDHRFKKKEARVVASPQLGFDVGIPSPQRQLRVVDAARSANADRYGLKIFKGMRVPAHSVLMAAFNSQRDVSYSADENQDWWETSESGPLKSLHIHVQAIKRGRYTYGLLTAST